MENFCFDNRKRFKVLLSKLTKNSQIYCPNLSVTMDTYKDLKKIRKYYSLIKNKPIERQPLLLINHFKKYENYIYMSATFFTMDRIFFDVKKSR